MEREVNEKSEHFVSNLVSNQFQVVEAIFDYSRSTARETKLLQAFSENDFLFFNCFQHKFDENINMVWEEEKSP